MVFSLSYTFSTSHLKVKCEVYVWIDALCGGAQTAHLMLRTWLPLLFSLSPNTHPFSFISKADASSRVMAPRYHLRVLYTEGEGGGEGERGRGKGEGEGGGVKGEGGGGVGRGKGGEEGGGVKGEGGGVKVREEGRGRGGEGRGRGEGRVNLATVHVYLH